MQEDWKYRTEQCTVPSGALEKTDRLFTAEVTEREERERRERRGRKIIAGAHARTHTHSVSSSSSPSGTLSTSSSASFPRVLGSCSGDWLCAILKQKTSLSLSLCSFAHHSPDFHQKMVTDAFELDIVDEEALATMVNRVTKLIYRTLL